MFCGFYGEGEMLCGKGVFWRKINPSYDWMNSILSRLANEIELKENVSTREVCAWVLVKEIFEVLTFKTFAHKRSYELKSLNSESLLPNTKHGFFMDNQGLDI